MTDSTDVAPDGRDDLWPAVNRLLADGSPEGARSHALGPLEAYRRSGVETPVPEVLATEARAAAFAMLSTKPLLERIRSACEGPLVLMKGPEIALRYPGGARGFIDVDLLVPDPRRTYAQLRAAGFVETSDPKFVQPLHHLRPLKWPDLPLQIEIHGRPKWPGGLQAPAAHWIIDSARPSGLSVEGVLAPQRAHHALLVAAHAWAHEPLWRLRDLTDVRALASPSERDAIERTARAWSMTRLWRTTDRVTDAVLGRGRIPLLVRPWARHLAELRERTVLENHLRDMLAAYSVLPVNAALATTAQAIAGVILPAPEESWSDKLSRILAASKNAHTPRSQYDRQLGEAATRGRSRKPRANGTSRLDDNLE